MRVRDVVQAVDDALNPVAQLLPREDDQGVLRTPTPQQVFPHRSIFVVILRQDVANHFHGVRRARHIGKAHSHRGGLDLGMAVQKPAKLCQHEAEVVRLRFWPQIQTRFQENLVAAAEVLDVDGGNGAVGNRHQRALFGADAGGTQANIFHRPGLVAETADVAHADDFIAENRYAAKKICDRLLRTEADSESANSKARQCGRHVEAEAGEDCEHSAKKDHRLDQALA